MLTVIGWVLWIAPLGVFALATTLGGSSGIAVLGALGHYVVSVVAIGTAVLIFAYVVAIVAAQPHMFVLFCNQAVNCSSAATTRASTSTSFARLQPASTTRANDSTP